MQFGRVRTFVGGPAPAASTFWETSSSVPASPSTSSPEPCACPSSRGPTPTSTSRCWSRPGSRCWSTTTTPTASRPGFDSGDRQNRPLHVRHHGRRSSGPVARLCEGGDRVGVAVGCANVLIGPGLPVRIGRARYNGMDRSVHVDGGVPERDAGIAEHRPVPPGRPYGMPMLPALTTRRRSTSRTYGMCVWPHTTVWWCAGRPVNATCQRLIGESTSTISSSRRGLP